MSHEVVFVDAPIFPHAVIALQDLKSPNILLDDRWRVKVTDFGLSRTRQQTYVSASGQGGTPEWMAPEVLRCEMVAEPADVYSYGVVLWELLTGQQPWETYNPMQVCGVGGAPAGGNGNRRASGCRSRRVCHSFRGWARLRRGFIGRVGILKGEVPAVVPGGEFSTFREAATNQE